MAKRNDLFAKGNGPNEKRNDLFAKGNGPNGKRNGPNTKNITKKYNITPILHLYYILSKGIDFRKKNI